MKILACAVSLCVSAVALAHGNALDMTAASVTQVLTQLKVDHPEHVEHFQGVKGWPEGDTLKVRIYLPDSATLTYVCSHDDTAASKVKCSMQM